MKYSVPMKFFAILLTALFLAVSAASAAGIAIAVEEELYTGTTEDWCRKQLSSRADSICAGILERAIARDLSNCTPEELAQLHPYAGVAFSVGGLNSDDYSYQVFDEKGTEVFSYGEGTEGQVFTYAASCMYPSVVERGLTDAQMQSYTNEGPWERAEDGTWTLYTYRQSPMYSVRLTVDGEKMLQNWGISLYAVKLLYAFRYVAIISLVLGLLLFAIGATYLCVAAGRTTGREEIRPGGLNRVPLDLYLAAGTGLVILSLFPVIYLVEDWLYRQTNFNAGTIVIVLSMLLAEAVIVVGFCFACAAQFKAKDYFWWRRSVTGFCVGLLWRLTKWAFRLVKRVARRLVCAVRKATELLPLVWRWVLIAAGMGFWILIGVAVAFATRSPVLLLLVLLGCIAVTVYGAYAFGILRKGAKDLAEGNLHARVNTKHLTGEYALCAQELNRVADVAVRAAKSQMKSERMKTELITNVSHDLKTPLTSIVNYVDLLGKPHTEEEGQQYLEVLQRQSQRMKKLIEDLMEVSKASTGNMAVELERMDLVEAVNQALGEFSDKLTLAQLTTVFRQPEQPAEILADGRLTWRVLSNLLSNAVKYALPGTRLYVDLEIYEDYVNLSLKNISREPLNVSADELTERFVRGDASRNTEGSGLGLNIARSLMELQNGKLALFVDGDLFKATICFPKMPQG